NKPIQTDTPDLKFELDSNKVNFFKSFIKDCIDSNVNLYIVASPRFIKNVEKDPSVKIATEITDEYNIPFYNYSSDTLFLKHHEYFYDRVHLNDRGARVFSNKVIDKILQNEELNSISKKYDWSAEKIKK
ncbi:MAG TPA: hypothetical protein VFI29_03350, partial [Hanamia sp.]|nr:hypothetical protein [Hanamia sp.]